MINLEIKSWEQAVKLMTVGSLITQTKLNGAAFMMDGFTTPEGYPFVLVVAVAGPGNERAVEFAQEFAAKMRAARATATAEARCRHGVKLGHCVSCPRTCDD